MTTLDQRKRDRQERAIEIAADAPLPDLTEAAIMVASLLADPFDRDARTEARLWLQAWRTAQPARCSTSTAKAATAAKGGV